MIPGKKKGDFGSYRVLEERGGKYAPITPIGSTLRSKKKKGEDVANAKGISNFTRKNPKIGWKSIETNKKKRSNSFGGNRRNGNDGKTHPLVEGEKRAIWVCGGVRKKKPRDLRIPEKED